LLRLRTILTLVVVLGITMGSVVHFSRADTARVTAIRTPHVVRPEPYVPIEDPMIAVIAAYQETYVRTLEGVDTRFREVVAFVDAQIPAAVPLAQPSGSLATPPAAGGGGGPITNEQFVALARCESGTVDDGVNTGGWRTGLYGIEDPRAGQMSPAEQRAYAQDIYNRHGASAWGVGCRGILGG
jgi:hypothetical protein